MGYSLVRQIVSTVSWTTFSVGMVFNCILARLILRHTPKQMQIYSRILMQNCVTDFLFIILTTIAEPILFSTAKGGNGRWLNGIVGQITNPDLRFIGFITFISYVFLVYVSLFNYVVQFIYRYLILNRSKTISTCQYLAMLFGTLIIPLIYCTLLGWAYYPLDGREFLDDPVVAEILDLNITGGQKILLAANSIEITWMVAFANYYIIVMCTLAYAIIWVLGWKMHKFIKNRKIYGEQRLKQEKLDDMNRQITKTLLIQACLPFTIYGPLLFILFSQLFGINVKLFSWIQYYYMLSIDPMWIPPAINPIVTIFTIRHYRKAFIKSIKMLANSLCCQFSTASVGGMVGTLDTTIQNTNININNININNINHANQIGRHPQTRQAWTRST